MARTTSTLVAEIIEVDEDIPLQPFIDVATELVTEVCAPVVTYSVTRLEQIERYLSAHFYAHRDPSASPISENAGSVGASYESRVDLNLASTRFGQDAMLLDTAGGLAKLNKEIVSGGKRIGKVYWLGKTQAELEEGGEVF